MSWHTFSAVMSYTMDTMSSYIADEISNKGCYIVESVGVLTHIQYCDVIYNGYDVLIYSGWDLKNSVGVISSVYWMWWHRYSGYYVKYSGWDVIKMVVWYHKARMWSLVECKRCHTLSESDVRRSVCDVLNRVRVMTQISGCDVTCIVYMWPYILDVVTYIEPIMA